MTSHAVGLELRDIALGRGVLPHAHVHRRRDDDRLVGRQQQRRREIVGDARGHLGEQIGGRRADEHEVGRAAKLDVADLDLVLQLPQRGVDLAFGERAEAHRRDEMLAAFGQHGRDLVAGFLEQPDELERLVCGNPAADDEEHPCHVISLAVHRRSSRVSRPGNIRHQLHCCGFLVA